MGNGEIRAALAAIKNTKKISWMAESSAVSLVEQNHEIAIEVADAFPEAILEIVEIAPEEALKIADSNPGEILNIANYLARIHKFDAVLDIIESFPSYAARIVSFTEKYGINPVVAFAKVKDGGSRIEIAKKYPVRVIELEKNGQHFLQIVQP